MLKRHFAGLALALVAISLVACGDAPESGRGIVAVSSINGGVPISSSAAVAGDLIIPCEFRFRPYNSFVDITEASPHGDIIIESYTVSWTRSDGGSGVIPSRSEVTSIFLSVYEPAIGSIRMVSAAEKGDPALSTLPATLIAHIDFVAREMGSEHDMEFSTEATVSFTN